MILKRHTVQTAVHFEGIGLHSGKPVKVTVHPSHDGLAFRVGKERTLARPENVTDTRRCTQLGSVAVIEHLMSAFAALEITDAEVEVTHPELPTMDGGAGHYYQGLIDTGLEHLGDEGLPDLFQRVYLHDEDIRIAIGKGDGHWRYEYSTGDRWPNFQAYSLEDWSHYGHEVAPARTFGFAEEIEPMQKAGLGLGLTEETALILDPEGYRFPARFPDEPARHKLLDVIGDLYLAGLPVRAINVVAERSGHRTNVEAAVRLRTAVFGKHA